ncbi:hypothetical protein [Streptomyces sp. ISL-100]|uniref:hypothetical protein n=1 Tax=Streptomyces sp. ISL-100 TaxID=2819173 RepID=UPI0027E57766|nr:hypothetical protein [Streptomyces sp. ISL-100]
MAIELERLSVFDRMVIPGIAEFTRGGLPAPAQTDDRNPWVDGYCWLYCGQRWTRVLWIGPASVAGIQAPMFACSSCIAELHERVWQSVLLADEPEKFGVQAQPVANDEHTRRRGGRHRGRSRFLR